MIVRYYWPDNKGDGIHGSELQPMDGFMVQATPYEAQKYIFPRLTPEQVEIAKNYAEMSKSTARYMGHPGRNYGFFVSRDLSWIESKEIHFPISDLWNGESPFKPFPKEIRIRRLEDLTQIILSR